MTEENQEQPLSGKKPHKKIKENEELQHTEKKQSFYAVAQPRVR
jgi:hypothetical protein